MEAYELYPGITLHYERDDRFKNEYLSVNFILSGELRDIAHASLLSSVLYCGSELHQTETQIESALLDLYDADLYAKGFLSGETFILPFGICNCADRFLPGETTVSKDMRDLLFELIFRPYTENGVFKKEYVKNQVTNKLEHLKAEKNNKPRYAVNKCIRTACAGEPIAYDTEQYKKDLGKVSPRSLYDFYKKVLSKAKVEVFYYGEESIDTLICDLKARLSPIFTPKLPLVPDTVSILKEKIERKTEEIKANQSTLCLCFKTDLLPGKDHYEAYMLVREMLCNSPVSLIFTNVREGMSLCYYCTDCILARKGVYVLYCGIDKKNATVAENAILSQLEKLKSGNFDDSLLEDCKRSLCGAFEEMKDSPPSIEDWYLRRILSDIDDTPDDVANKIAFVTREEVILAANTLCADCVYLLKGTSTKEDERRE